MNLALRSLPLLTLATAAVAAHAVSLTDVFSIDQAGVTRTTTGSSTSTGTPLGGGLTRTLIVTQNSNASGTASSSVRVSGGAFLFANDSQATSNYAIDYAYNPTASFVGITGFQVDFSANDKPYTLFIDVVDSANGVSTYTGSVGTSTSPFTVSARPISNGADLSRVSRISFQSDGTLAGTHSTIARVASVQPVPEPPALAALGLGAVALLRRRK